ncbi:MAG: adenylosuccinate synthase [Candidatus Cloacimonadota bacterium]|nr:MAG: adenylosuccinate synthase [Candidatus Cloacimonadota bacterium]PIE77607.1 MAG: adenylosuccinate synthase [Candidatus Delongbacteria bacterium]
MGAKIVVGTQWGDEGKGKIVDLISEKADLVVRAQGGANAGHTVIINGKSYILHIIPSGILHAKTICAIGNGVVFDYRSFMEELKMLKDNGVDPKGRLFISPFANVVMPYHPEYDRAREAARKDKIGTTSKGIGPAYNDKITRTGIRVIDILNDDIFRAKLHNNIEIKNHEFEKLYGVQNRFSFEEIYKDCSNVFAKIRDYVKDVSIMIDDYLKADKKVVFEGAQGTLLDIDFGTFPFVTSSNTTSGGACTGTGVGPTKIDEVTGVLKAYTTRVGNGPFVSELDDEYGNTLGKVGHEFGATTGRKRRCGAFDILIAKFSARINGLTSFALTKLDVLDSFDTIRVCTGYKYKGNTLTEYPVESYILEECEAVYTELPGWKEDISNIKDYDKLPENCKKYVEFIERETGVKADIISVGPDRNQTIFR